MDREEQALTDEIYELAKQTLFQAIEALEEHRESVILVGAQAVYIHTSHITSPVQPFTTDADLVLDSRHLQANPGIDALLARAGFLPNPASDAVGSWVSPAGIPLDLMVPASYGGGGRRAARLPNHGDRTLRKTQGLEAVLFDNSPHSINDSGSKAAVSYEIPVAGPAALLIAKLVKFSERAGTTRLIQKDAYDIYRLLLAVERETLVTKLIYLGSLPGVEADLSLAIHCLKEHFAKSPDAQGSRSAGDSERLVGDPDRVSNRVWALSNEMLEAMAI